MTALDGTVITSSKFRVSWGQVFPGVAFFIALALPQAQIAFHQTNFRANWICRGSVEVVSITPAEPS